VQAGLLSVALIGIKDDDDDDYDAKALHRKIVFQNKTKLQHKKNNTLVFYKLGVLMRITMDHL
jgi:hypothetical protein